jgi:hypothetical protein
VRIVGKAATPLGPTKLCGVLREESRQAGPNQANAAAGRSSSQLRKFFRGRFTVANLICISADFGAV